MQKLDASLYNNFFKALSSLNKRVMFHTFHTRYHELKKNKVLLILVILVIQYFFLID